MNFDDAAPGQLAQAGPWGSANSTVTAKPTDYDPLGAPDPFASPAPTPSSATTLATLAGSDPNGTWSLYVVDDIGPDTGTIAGGWCVDFAEPSADLSITKTDGVATAIPGGSVTYTITASNAGPSNASGATVEDTFPASLTATWTCSGVGGGTCTPSGSGNINDSVNLPAATSVTYTVSASVDAAATRSLENTATVTAPIGLTEIDHANKHGDRHRRPCRCRRSHRQHRAGLGPG